MDEYAGRSIHFPLFRLCEMREAGVLYSLQDRLSANLSIK